MHFLISHFISFYDALEVNYKVNISDDINFWKVYIGDVYYFFSKMTIFQSPVDKDLLLAEKTFSNIAKEYGKSTPELRNAVRASTTLFIHYVVDFAVQRKQGSDEDKVVSLKPNDIYHAIGALGFDNIIRKLKTKQSK